jgi:hypothetical protein
MVSVQEMRVEFAAVRAEALKLGMSKEMFARRAQSLAHELADGEEVLPRHWVMGAEEAVWELKQKGGK